MINLRILVPEATVNYITNPQFRYSTTGWTTVGATLTRSLDFARFGIASGKVVTSGAALQEGVYFRVNSLAGISDSITVSGYLRGNSGNEKIRLRLQDDPTGQEWVSEVVELRTDRWKRVEVTGRCTGSNDIRLKVETADIIARAYTFYVDRAQMERKPYSTSYCDGDQPGCAWSIVSNGSNSVRTADTREGGRWIPLAGPCRPDNDIYVTVLGGFGEPPVQNNIQPWSLSPGSYFQNQKILDRVVTMNFTVKKEMLRENGLNLRSLHEMRQQLVDLFKTDKTLNDEAFWFEYSETNSDKPLYMRFRYEAGLEGSWDVRNGWFNTFSLRLLAVEPMWVEDTYEVKQLTIKQPYNFSPTYSNLFAKILGEWQPIKNSAGTNVYAVGGDTGQVNAIAIGPDGTVYFGGNFTSVGFRIAKWDGTTITELGGGGANNIIYGLAVGADGSVYAVGDFTTIGGVACTRVAKYNPTTNTWSAMGTGLNGTGRTVCVGNNGQVYVGGDFTSAGGVTCQRVARWDGLQWRTVGATSGVNNSVYTIVKGIDERTLYMGGLFTASNGGSVTYNFVCQIDTYTNLLSQMGNGIDGGIGGAVTALAVDRSGTVYAGGSFGVSLCSVMRWSGGALWSKLGAGLYSTSGTITFSMAIGINGELLCAGGFDFISSATGARALKAFAKYYGDTWNPIELGQGTIVSTSFGVSIAQHPNGSIFVGMTGNIGTNVPKINTINNPGSASVFPKMYIAGPGTLKYISNIKTGQEIFLELPISSGEEVFIDFAKGTIQSTTRGNLLFSLFAGSEIRSIYLLPGDNQISVLMTNDVSASMQIGFQPQDWSADAIVDAEALQ